MGKKRTPSENQRAIGLNQLTLSASIKRDVPAGNDIQKPRNVARAESIELLDLTQLQAKPSSKPSSRPADQQKKQSQRSGSMNSQSMLTKRATPQLGFAKQTARTSSMNSDVQVQKSSSSDYGGSCLDDLPSPSALLPDGMDAAGGYPSRGNNNLSKPNDDDALDTKESLIGLDDPWLLFQPDHYGDQQESALKGNNFVDCSVDTANIAEQEVQPSSLDSLDPFSISEGQGHSPFLRSSRDPTLNRTPEPEAAAGQKRAAFVLNGDEEGSDGGRKKQRLYPPCDNYHEPENAVINPPVDRGHQENVEFNASTTVPKDWEGIDPLLLEEFKDVVNFF